MFIRGWNNLCERFMYLDQRTYCGSSWPSLILYFPLAITRTHTKSHPHPHTHTICSSILTQFAHVLFLCVCVIDSHHMRWSMFASGHFALWALSSTRWWPASQALFFHLTIGFLSTTVTLSRKNTQSCWLLRTNYSLFLPLKAADFTDISPFRSECFEFSPRFDTHTHGHTCTNTRNRRWRWQKNLWASC